MGADGAAGSFQLFGGAGADKAHSGFGIFLFQHAGGKDHGGHSHGNIVCKVGEVLFRQHAPCRAAGSAHKRLFGRHFMQKVTCFIHGAEVSTDGNLHHIVKAQCLEGRADLAALCQLGELIDKGGSQQCIDTVAAVKALNQLIDLPLIGNGAEGTVYKALPAGNALIVIDLRAAQRVAVDSAHATGIHAGTLNFNDGLIGANVSAVTALNTLGLINKAAAAAERDGTFGANFHAGMRKTALAKIGYLHRLFGAAVAGKLDNIDQRRIIVLMGNGGIFQTGNHAVVFIDTAQRQTQCKAHTLFNDGALQENIAAQLAHFSGHDLKGNVPHHLVCFFSLYVGITHAGYFRKYLAADLVNSCINTAITHLFTSLMYSIIYIYLTT